MDEKFGISTKKYMLEEVKEKLRASPNFVITRYKGLDAVEIEKLRRSLRQTSSTYFVIKNSIIKRAFDELNLKDLKQSIEGEIGLSLAGDVIKMCKVLVNFAKTHDTFSLGCGFIDGKKEGNERIRYLATLPSREALLAIAVTYMKSPLVGFVGVFNGLLRKLVLTLNAIKEKREK